jgi:hypothetical protein
MIETSYAVIPGRPTDLGCSRDRHLNVPKSATADLGGPGPESIITNRAEWAPSLSGENCGYGFCDLRFARPRNDKPCLQAAQ